MLRTNSAKEKENSDHTQYVITNREEGKGKPPRLFLKTGYPLRYREPALQQKTEERERKSVLIWVRAFDVPENDKYSGQLT